MRTNLILVLPTAFSTVPEVQQLLAGTEIEEEFGIAVEEKLGIEEESGIVEEEAGIVVEELEIVEQSSGIVEELDIVLAGFGIVVEAVGTAAGQDNFVGVAQV